MFIEKWLQVNISFQRKSDARDKKNVSIQVIRATTAIYS